jgi:hypothetical protein
MPQHMCRGQRITCRSQVSLSTILLLDTEFRPIPLIPDPSHKPSKPNSKSLQDSLLNVTQGNRHNNTHTVSISLLDWQVWNCEVTWDSCDCSGRVGRNASLLEFIIRSGSNNCYACPATKDVVESVFWSHWK